MEISNLTVLVPSTDSQIKATKTTTPSDDVKADQTFGISIATNNYRPLSDEQFEARSEKIGAMMLKIQEQGETNSPTQKFYRSMDKALEAINQQAPGLKDKHWDFSVDEAGDIVLKDTEELTEEEQSLIIDTLTKYGVNTNAADYADDMIFITEMDRSEFGVSNNIGQYNITRENFSEIIDMKQLYEDSNTVDREHSGHPMLVKFAMQLGAKAESTYKIVYEKPAPITYV